MADETSTLTLFIRHRGALVDYADGIVGSRAEAEDLVQEAWLRLEKARRHRPLNHPLAYLYRIVRNLAFDVRRQMTRERKVMSEAEFEVAAATQADDASCPERVARSEHELKLVLDAMAELPERTRIALQMHRFGGCKLREIAAFLGISIPLAHILVADGVEHCKRRLERS